MAESCVGTFFAICNEEKWGLGSILRSHVDYPGGQDPLPWLWIFTSRMNCTTFVKPVSQDMNAVFKENCLLANPNRSIYDERACKHTRQKLVKWCIFELTIPRAKLYSVSRLILIIPKNLQIPEDSTTLSKMPIRNNTDSIVICALARYENTIMRSAGKRVRKFPTYFTHLSWRYERAVGSLVPEHPWIGRCEAVAEVTKRHLRKRFLMSSSDMYETAWEYLQIWCSWTTQIGRHCCMHYLNALWGGLMFSHFSPWLSLIRENVWPHLKPTPCCTDLRWIIQAWWSSFEVVCTYLSR